MPHDYNKEAFGRIGNDSSNPLCAVYCSLVVLELAIKDYFYTPDNANSWKTGHSIVQWLTNLDESSLGSQLENKLFALRCTDINGDEARVKANKYPDLRYLRHEQDFPGTSTDAGLRDVMDIIQDIQVRLKMRGIID
jgi:hypothetical protein